MLSTKVQFSTNAVFQRCEKAESVGHTPPREPLIAMLCLPRASYPHKTVASFLLPTKDRRAERHGKQGSRT